MNTKGPLVSSGRSLTLLLSFLGGLQGFEVGPGLFYGRAADPLGHSLQLLRCVREQDPEKMIFLLFGWIKQVAKSFFMHVRINFFKILILCIFKPASPQATHLRFLWKNSEGTPMLRDLIKDTLPLIKEEIKALAPGGLELGTSILRDQRPNHFATTTTALCPY